MFKVIKKDDELGAYIEDINLSNISEKTSIGLLSCLAENEVLFFRNQNISPRAVSYTHLRAHETKANLV